MKSLRTLIIFSTLAFAACSQQGDIASPAGEVAQADPQVFQFHRHVDPAAKPTDSFHRDRTIPEALDACGNTCMKGWQNAFDFCMGDHPHATAAKCEVIAHDSVAACMDNTCIAAPEDGGRLGQCAATCDDEVAIAIEECMSQTGNPWHCEEEANSIYRTCYDGDCRGADSHAAAASHNWDIDFAAHEAANNIPAPTCEDMCAAYDVKIYLQCLDANPERPDLCREAVGQAFHRCTESHCAGT